MAWNAQGGGPIRLGKVIVTLAITPEKVTKNLPALTTNGTIMGARKVQSIFIQALPGNTGVVYVGGPGLVVATGVDVMVSLPKGESITIKASETMNLFNLDDVFLAVATDADAAYVTAQRV